MAQFKKPHKLTPTEIKEEDARMQKEEIRISLLDPNCKAAKRRAAFYARCKISDTKMQV